MRTKQEVINFLESKLGTKVVCVGNSNLDGQCVTLIKSLMEFLGIPDPYKARGHAKTVISAYLSEGIANPGPGFLSVFSNKNMGGGYGHIWINAGDGAGTFYESNGVKPLIVTKGKTYQYDNVCNFDKYIKEGDMVEVDSQKFEELVTKATKFDKFVAMGYSSPDDIERLEIDKKTLEDWKRFHICQIKEIDENDGVEWEINGKTKDSNGVVTYNYKIKEG